MGTRWIYIKQKCLNRVSLHGVADIKTYGLGPTTVTICCVLQTV